MTRSGGPSKSSAFPNAVRAASRGRRQAFRPFQRGASEAQRALRNFTHALPVFADLSAENGFTLHGLAFVRADTGQIATDTIGYV